MKHFGVVLTQIGCQATDRGRGFAKTDGETGGGLDAAVVCLDSDIFALLIVVIIIVVLIVFFVFTPFFAVFAVFMFIVIAFAI